MKCTIPEISWHNREPVLSVDIHPISENFYRLASGGADCHVLIWQLNVSGNGAVKLEALSDLTRHQRAVNSVRWAPEGQYLATADDDANIIIWQLKTDNIPLLEGESNDKEIWIAHKVMRGHKEDIYDICWSPNCQKLLSGSIDNTAILWDFAKGKNDNILMDHKGFVQGVTWDPKNQYIATISTDRICRIYDTLGKQVKVRIQKGYLPVPNDHYLYNKEVKLFHDDTFKSFFRRLDFSPDGTLLAVPSGRVEIEDCKKVLYATYIFAVDIWGGPIAVFPSSKQCSTVVRFCPVLFELHENGPDAIITLPYRMIIAIGTDHDVILYDTQQMAPFAYFKDIHYTRLTDLTWSKDGQLLVASSTDGFCALITFEVNELGVPYAKEEESEIEDNVINISGCEELVDKDDNFDILKEKNDTKPKKLNLLEQWTLKTSKKAANCDDVTYINEKHNTDLVLSSKDNTIKKNIENSNTPVIHKRIKPIEVQTNKINNQNAFIQKDSFTPTSLTLEKQEKVSPFLNFFKGGLKNRSDDNKKTKIVTSLQPDLVLDEVEARDAFPSKNVEYKCSNQHMVDDDYTEEFSLHLEDTNTASKSIMETLDKEDTVNEISSVKSTLKQNIKDMATNSVDDTSNLDVNMKEVSSLVKETSQVNVDTLEKVKDNEKIENNMGVKKCVPVVNSIPNETEDCLESEKILSNVQLENCLENKIITKRRIPLITLSSPKHKKK